MRLLSWAQHRHALHFSSTTFFAFAVFFFLCSDRACRYAVDVEEDKIINEITVRVFAETSDRLAEVQKRISDFQVKLAMIQEQIEE